MVPKRQRRSRNDGGKKVAFIPRHGAKHTIAPHKINYRANLWAMKSLGVTRLISPCAAGSLQKHVKPGRIRRLRSVCRPHQRTCRHLLRRSDCHARVGCRHILPRTSSVAVKAGEAAVLRCIPKGTVVVIQGPRFSSKANQFGSGLRVGK